MWRRRERLSRSAERVGLRRRGLFFILEVKILVAVSGEWARERRECAGCEGVVGRRAGRGEDVMMFAADASLKEFFVDAVLTV